MTSAANRLPGSIVPPDTSWGIDQACDDVEAPNHNSLAPPDKPSEMIGSKVSPPRATAGDDRDRASVFLICGPGRSPPTLQTIIRKIGQIAALAYDAGMTEDNDELEKKVAAMTIEELIAELGKADPKILRASLEEALIDLGLTNADMRALLEAALKRAGPLKH